MPSWQHRNIFALFIIKCAAAHLKWNVAMV
jgi:hypothetical protein